MKYNNIIKIILAITIITTAGTAKSHFYKEDAKIACSYKLVHGDYYGMHDMTIDNRGHGSYKITGKMRKRHSKHTSPFVCKVRHGEVVNWNIRSRNPSGHNSAHNSGHHNNNAALVGAGILALAAAAAANQNNHANHQTGGNPFEDMRNLVRQCKQNIRRHISNEDEAVKSIHLNTHHLHRRTLVGEGGVIFRRGGGSDISYECKFDRRGRIYDGHYRFR